MKRISVFIVSLFIILTAKSQSLVKIGVVDAYAVVTASPPTITVKWNAGFVANSCKIRKKAKEDASWGAYIDLDKAANSYVDNGVQLGKVYEYNIVRNLPYLSNKDAIQNISVGIAVPVVDSRGKVILLVEQSVAPSLKTEIDRLIIDMTCDGWQVMRYDVSKTETVPNVKNIIKTAYNTDPANVKTLFILGHVPVPYSGNIAPDGHGDHAGAWPADGYYGDVNGTWTDATVNTTTATDPANDNIPGDGKFDQNTFPTDLELQVGRVDMYNLPRMKDYDAAMTETELLRRYLDKDHAFRTREFGTINRALINDQFYISYGDNYATGAYASNITSVGTANITEQYNDGAEANHIFRDKHDMHYLYAYAGGPGGTTSVGTAINTDDFAGKNVYFNYVFTCLFGSYLGDWDKSNNVMRSALASKGSILTCAWSGRPYWWFQHMDNGENIGYSARINMNNNGNYFALYYYKDIHISLLGDPTLRSHIITPVQNFSGSVVNNHVKLSWSPCIDSILGYHVYKSTNISTAFTRLTTNLITDTTYTDPAAADPKYIYVVKAVRLESNRSGTYYNTSRGALVSNIDTVKDVTINLHPPKVAAHVPDTSMILGNAYSYNFAETFVDPDAFDNLTYTLTMADKSAVPTGWTFTAASKTLNAPAPKQGTYKFVIKVTDSQMFETTDTFTVKIGVTSIDIATRDEAKIKVYPNPCEDIIHVQMDKEDNDKITFILYDAAGALILQKQFNNKGKNSSFNIETESLTSGVYYYVVRSETSIYQGKIIKL